MAVPEFTRLRLLFGQPPAWDAVSKSKAAFAGVCQGPAVAPVELADRDSSFTRVIECDANHHVSGVNQELKSDG